MSAIFDHLTAILVGATLLVALVFVQVRQRQGAIETTLRHTAEATSGSAFSVLQRDAENIRTAPQAMTAFGQHRFSVARATGLDGQSYTSQFVFPTLAEPDLGAVSAVALVGYIAVPTGTSVRVGTAMRPTYRVTRYEYRRGQGSRVTGGIENVVDFNVLLVQADGSEVGVYDYMWHTPVQVKLSMAIAQTGTERRAGDQATTGVGGLVRHAMTVRVLAAAARGGMPTPESGPTGLPPVFGGVPLPVPWVPPPPPPGGGGGGEPYPPPSSSPGSGGSPPPPQPPPPPLPPDGSGL